jgi:hypothetical protein
MPNHKTEYEERFSWRKQHFIANLDELSTIAQPGGPDVIQLLPSLFKLNDNESKEDALRWSILSLWLQAAECYIFQQYEPCILTCGAILERVLKLEYQVVNGDLPTGNWTLGKCIYDLDWTNTKIDETILNLVAECLDPRNDRAHALLEHSNPSLSIIGGKKRSIQELSNVAHFVEAFKGDAKVVIFSTWKVLVTLYGN